MINARRPATSNISVFPLSRVMRRSPARAGSSAPMVMRRRGREAIRSRIGARTHLLPVRHRTRHPDPGRVQQRILHELFKIRTKMVHRSERDHAAERQQSSAAGPVLDRDLPLTAKEDIRLLHRDDLPFGRPDIPVVADDRQDAIHDPVFDVLSSEKSLKQRDARAARDIPSCPTTSRSATCPAAPRDGPVQNRDHDARKAAYPVARTDPLSGKKRT